MFSAAQPAVRGLGQGVARPENPRCTTNIAMAGEGVNGTLRAGCVSYSAWVCRGTREEESLQRRANSSDLNHRSLTRTGVNRSSDSTCRTPGYGSPPAKEVVSLQRS